MHAVLWVSFHVNIIVASFVSVSIYGQLSATIADVLVTYTYDEYASDFVLELPLTGELTPNNAWVALGFNDAPQMVFV